MITNLQNYFWKRPKSQSKNVEFAEHRFVWKTLSSQVDLIWHLRPIRKVENARTLILFLSKFLQKLAFYDQKHEAKVSLFNVKVQFLKKV